MSKTPIIKGTRLMEFFRDKVQAAIANQRLDASEMAEYYLVNLLQEFRRVEKLFEIQGKNRIEKPLAILLLEAMEGDSTTRMRCLKQLGDTALYVAGFFADNISRKLVDQEYYISMGCGAYGSLSAILLNEKTFGDLYNELASKFPELVSILAEVAPWHDISNNLDLLRIYERWLRTGDERLESLLRREGIAVDGAAPPRRPQ